MTHCSRKLTCRLTRGRPSLRLLALPGSPLPVLHQPVLDEPAAILERLVLVAVVGVDLDREDERALVAGLRQDRQQPLEVDQPLAHRHAVVGALLEDVVAHVRVHRPRQDLLRRLDRVLAGDQPVAGVVLDADVVAARLDAHLDQLVRGPPVEVLLEDPEAERRRLLADDLELVDREPELTRPCNPAVALATEVAGRRAHVRRDLQVPERRLQGGLADLGVERAGDRPEADVRAQVQLGQPRLELVEVGARPSTGTARRRGRCPLG